MDIRLKIQVAWMPRATPRCLLDQNKEGGFPTERDLGVQHGQILTADVDIGPYVRVEILVDEPRPGREFSAGILDLLHASSGAI